MENTPLQSSSTGFQKLLRWWLQPRAMSRDEAFRERVIRSTTAIVLVIAVLSFAMTVVVFDDEWTFISFPSLYTFVISGLLFSAFAVHRGDLKAAGWALVLTALFATSILLLLSRQTSTLPGIINTIPTYMLGVVISALVLPTKYIVPVSLLAGVMYSVTQFGMNIGDFELEGLVGSQQIPSIFILFLMGGVLLRQLRVEFDARLEAMSVALEEEEIAKKQAEEARQRAEAADHAKSQFLANMSHELRTPLNAIIGYDEAMIGGMVGELTDQQLKILGHIQHNSRRLLNLINDILDLSKIESGSLEVYLAPLSLHEVIERTVESVRNLADEKAIYLKVEITEAVPEVILGDVRKLEQIIVNLLSNAIKFTSAGGITVAVDIVNSDRWRMRVIDTGIGIPQASRKSIFEPFQQVDGSSTRKYKGTGLGLAITKRLIEGMDGTIHVTSEEGKGSTFTVELPRAKIPVVPEENPVEVEYVRSSQ